MGLFGDKDAIVGAALGAGNAFNKNKETNRAAIYGSAMGACIGSGKKWIVEDSIKLEGTIRALDRRKNR
ncbi:MAG: hypothetical protein UCH84_08130 [Eubacterium sp.]|nr:hypothetical protein [Eubacterium sp.]